MMRKRQRIVLTGGTGFLGRVLAAHFRAAGHEVIVIGRRTEPVRWDGRTLGPWAHAIDGADAVINLAGRTVDCRYNATNRQQILDSRIESTRILGTAIAQAKVPPPVWLNASSATIYPHTLDQDRTEGCTLQPQGFSEDVCHRWEAELNAAETPNTRRVALRISIAFGPERGGAVDIIHRLVRCGLGGSQGPGDQVVSWIHTDDLVRAVDWLLEHEDLAGPVNLAAPCPLGNKAFMRIFRKAAGMHLGLPTPTPILRLGAIILRTEAELILKSRRVVPSRLLASGFEFQFPAWGVAITDILTRRG